MHQMVAQRMEIARFGGARLLREQLCRIADRVGLPTATMDKALDRWTNDGDDGLAFLEEVAPNTYHIADNDKYGQARRFLDETARRSKQGRRRGLRSGRKRRK